MVAVILLYGTLLMVNLFFAWVAFIGQRPFLHRWQLVAWHLGLAIVAGATAQYAYRMSPATGWQMVIRLAWLWCVIIGLIVIASWLRRIVSDDCK